MLPAGYLFASGLVAAALGASVGGVAQKRQEDRIVIGYRNVNEIEAQLLRSYRTLVESLNTVGRELGSGIYLSNYPGQWTGEANFRITARGVFRSLDKAVIPIEIRLETARSVPAEYPELLAREFQVGEDFIDAYISELGLDPSKTVRISELAGMEPVTHQIAIPNRLVSRDATGKSNLNDAELDIQADEIDFDGAAESGGTEEFEDVDYTAWESQGQYELGQAGIQSRVDSLLSEAKAAAQKASDALSKPVNEIDKNVFSDAVSTTKQSAERIGFLRRAQPNSVLSGQFDEAMTAYRNARGAAVASRHMSVIKELQDLKAQVGPGADNLEIQTSARARQQTLQAELEHLELVDMELQDIAEGDLAMAAKYLADSKQAVFSRASNAREINGALADERGIVWGELDVLQGLEREAQALVNDIASLAATASPGPDGGIGEGACEGEGCVPTGEGPIDTNPGQGEQPGNVWSNMPPNAHEAAVREGRILSKGMSKFARNTPIDQATVDAGSSIYEHVRADHGTTGDSQYVSTWKDAEDALARLEPDLPGTPDDDITLEWEEDPEEAISYLLDIQKSPNAVNVDATLDRFNPSTSKGEYAMAGTVEMGQVRGWFIMTRTNRQAVLDAISSGAPHEASPSYVKNEAFDAAKFPGRGAGPRYDLASFPKNDEAFAAAWADERWRPFAESSPSETLADFVQETVADAGYAAKLRAPVDAPPPVPPRRFCRRGAVPEDCVPLDEGEALPEGEVLPEGEAVEVTNSVDLITSEDAARLVFGETRVAFLSLASRFQVHESTGLSMEKVYTMFRKRFGKYKLFSTTGAVQRWISAKSLFKGGIFVAGLALYVEGLVRVYENHESTFFDKMEATLSIVPIANCAMKQIRDAAKGKSNIVDTMMCYTADAFLYTPLWFIGVIIHALREPFKIISGSIRVYKFFQSPGIVSRERQEGWWRFVRRMEWNPQLDSALRDITRSRFSAETVSVLFQTAPTKGALLAVEAATRNASARDEDDMLTLRLAPLIHERLELDACVEVSKRLAEMRANVSAAAHETARAMADEWEKSFYRDLRAEMIEAQAPSTIWGIKTHAKPTPEFIADLDYLLNRLRQSLWPLDLMNLPRTIENVFSRAMAEMQLPEACSFCRHEEMACRWEGCLGGDGWEARELQLTGFDVAVEVMYDTDLPASLSDECRRRFQSCPGKRTYNNKGEWGAWTTRKLKCLRNPDKRPRPRPAMPATDLADPEPRVTVCRKPGLEAECGNVKTPYGECVAFSNIFGGAITSLLVEGASSSCDVFQSDRCETADNWDHDQFNAVNAVPNIAASHPRLDNRIYAVRCHSPRVNLCKESGGRACTAVAAPFGLCIPMPDELSASISSIRPAPDKFCDFFEDDLCEKKLFTAFGDAERDPAQRIATYRCHKKERVTVSDGSDLPRYNFIENALDQCVPITIEQSFGVELGVHSADVSCSLFSDPECKLDERQATGWSRVEVGNFEAYRSIRCNGTSQRIIAAPEIIATKPDSFYGP